MPCGDSFLAGNQSVQVSQQAPCELVHKNSDFDFSMEMRFNIHSYINCISNDIEVGIESVQVSDKALPGVKYVLW